MDSYYVTTPIYYVNDAPHIGHAYTTILADVLSRYHRLLGVPTYFLTGTDEHGQKVADAAKKAGISPLEHCDKTVVRFQELWERLGISNDDFIRTTETRHSEVVQEILQDLYDRDEIYRGDYEGWYSVTEEVFYTEKDLVDGKTPEGNTVEKIVESNYFFRMSKYQDWLIEKIESDPQFIQPDFRRNETLGFLRKPLGDLCISRPKSRMDWGIELPFDRDYVCYVWFDALVNYISAIGYRRDEKQFSEWWPATCHLIGKDILTTHTVYWPTMLQAMGVPQPKTVFAHGWWLLGDAKMSKSKGNVVDPMAMSEQYGVDPFRYFLLAEMTLGSDSSFSEDLFITRYNTDLANDLGNFASRVTKMIHTNFDGEIPAPGEPGEDEAALAKAVLDAVAAVESSIESIALDRGIAAVLGAVGEANRYFDKTRPWTLAKEGKREELAVVLYAGAEALRILSGLLFPVMPEKMSELRRTLGIADDSIVPGIDELRTWGGLEAGTSLGEAAVLFPRIDARKDDAAKKGQAGGGKGKGNDNKKAKGKAAMSNEATKDNETEGVAKIGFDDFTKVELRTARVLEAERVPDTDKLLRLQLEVGDERRQIVAGIAAYYEPEAIVGKTIVIVANLKPAKIRGVESNGMLLAAKTGDTLRVVTADGEIASGASVG